VDLAGRDLSRIDLRGADLTGANLAGAILYEAKLDDADFTGAALVGAVLVECDGERVSFAGADLSAADLTAARLPHASFNQAVLKGTDLRSAKLSGSRFYQADARKADLTRADLSGSEWVETQVAEVSFRDADLSGSRLRGLQGYRTGDWVGTDLRNTHMAGASALRSFANDQNFLEEFYHRSPAHKVAYGLWWVTSDCGRSFVRWGSWTALIAVVFAWAFTFVNIDYGDDPTALSPLYFSIVTLTTLGYGDALPTDIPSQLVVIAEVVCGYVMLGGLLAILGNKMARRA
jgi:uncharacterized protein YjbI with pentapeptide repeats